MFVAMSLIPVGDGIGKLLVTGPGFNPYFLAWSRFTLGMLMVLLIVAYRMAFGSQFAPLVYFQLIGSGFAAALVRKRA